MDFIKKTSIHPVIAHHQECEALDLSKGYDPVQITSFIELGGRAAGGYNEKRPGMYVAAHFGNLRNIHMGIDFWAPAGETVFAIAEGQVVYTANHASEGNYGGTVVLKHRIQEKEIFALYGHLSYQSLEKSVPGKALLAGDTVGWLGEPAENGNWPPHLHFQLSYQDPGEADMPGVVSEDDRQRALKIYPDPRIFLGPVY
ncbi:peptidoglycan DD-metalloendopeptidase family protein [Rhodohalobacter mucosus]|uniref:Peptidase M23 n=1 Tax=Rhodohalobacter mucosus TaxID=2079485 RepID=A0A316TLI9_9BACT|nr:peptidoglycan DD-metalloendopeptidase family protein [Rhodohalobacter mucosus]PWN05250.1 peptidase M23 [Rhodohalobacter mucosus]